MKRMSTAVFVLVGLAVAVAMVVLLAPNANPNPDGLEKVAADHGLDREVREHALADGPLADYGVSGVDDRYLSTWVAGLIGVAVTFAVGAGLVLLVRRDRHVSEPVPPAAA